MLQGRVLAASLLCGVCTQGVLSHTHTEQGVILLMESIPAFFTPQANIAARSLGHEKEVRIIPSAIPFKLHLCAANNLRTDSTK